MVTIKKERMEQSVFLKYSNASLDKWTAKLVSEYFFFFLTRLITKKNAALSTTGNMPS
jgi:hypothetical protein